MSNLIESSFDNLSLEEMQAISEKLQNKMIAAVIEKQKEILDLVNKNAAKINDIKEDQEKKLQVAVNSMRVNSPRYGWVNQTTFGQYFEPSMSNVTVGKLFKIVGLAMSSRGRTTPYRKYIGEKHYARIKTYEQFSTTEWHFERCVDFVDDWLEENQLYEDFYATETEEERKIFIDELYAKRGF